MPRARTSAKAAAKPARRPAPAGPALSAKARDKALKAASALMIEVGLDKVTIPEVARRAGLEAAAVKRQFGSALHLSAAALEVWAEADLKRSEREVLAAFDHFGDVEAGIAAIFEAQLKRYARLGWWRLHRIVDRAELSDEHRRVIDLIEDDFGRRAGAFVKEFQARGLVDPRIDAAALHVVWAGILDGIALRGRLERAKPAALARQIASVLAWGLAPRSGA